MAKRYDSILQTIGRTPVVRLNRLAPPGVNVFVKAEAFNPMGSVKDRLALGVIEDAERRGSLRLGQTVVEATSGNTGIGLAMVCAAKGYPLVVTMAENFSVERRRMMRFLGARVVLTPASEKGSGMLRKAAELAEAHGWFLTRQFDNEANADAHSRTTAREILGDFADTRLDAWVTGFGTGGTLKGVARVLRAERPDTAIIVCEPDNAPLLGSGVAQPRDADGSIAASHPAFRPHVMQGWSPDFVAKLAEDAAAMKLIDRVVPIDGQEAMRLSRELAQKEGIFTGITGGATLAGAIRVAAELSAGANVLCMLPDTGERYLSTPLFENVPVEMTSEELAISRSTPSCRFDAKAPVAAPVAPSPAVAPAPPPPPLDDEARRFVAAALADPDHPVVMFALQWCEFCWSVRKLFARCGVAYRSVDLDSVEYQHGDRGGAIRAALTAHTGCVTIPQVFIGGQYIGGCTDTFDALRDGSLAAMLAEAGVSFDAESAASLDPYSLLPRWLQPR